MPLTERTERALEACYDAILAPPLWSSALQLLGESFGAASCTLYEHDREHSPAPVPMSAEHEAYSVRWARNANGHFRVRLWPLRVHSHHSARSRGFCKPDVRLKDAYTPLAGLRSFRTLAAIARMRK
jgi:hypothetical protein